MQAGRKHNEVAKSAGGGYGRRRAATPWGTKRDVTKGKKKKKFERRLTGDVIKVWRDIASVKSCRKWGEVYSGGG